MPIYTINATAGLSTEISPDGYLASNEIEDLEDESYYPYRELDYELEFSFSVEADDEESARLEAERIVRGVRFDSHGGPEWEVMEPEITEITPVVVPMNIERALEILRTWIGVPSHSAARDRPVAVTLTPEILETLDYVIAYIVTQNAYARNETVEAMAAR